MNQTTELKFENFDLRPQAKIVSHILKTLGSMVEPGVRLSDLEQMAEIMINKAGATSYNRGYHPAWTKSPYPAILCTNVNDGIAHNPPTNYKLQEGDIINIDLGIKFGSFCGDAALTVPVGQIENKHERLLRYAKRTLYEGIKHVKAGVEVWELGRVMGNYALQMGYVTIKSFTGHKIGFEMHDGDCYIFNYDPPEDIKAKYGHIKLEAGDVICLEPMLTFKDSMGKCDDPTGWAWKTRDGKSVAMFEHMILVKEDGYEILTDHISEEVKA
mgnify:CR=1 FL=1